MKPSTGTAVRLHRNAVRDRPESLSAFKWNACPPSPEYASRAGSQDNALAWLNGEQVEHRISVDLFEYRITPAQCRLCSVSPLS